MMAERILLSISQHTLSLDPGGTGTTTISIHNRSSIVDQFSLSIEGIDSDWFDLSASSVKLFPGDEDTVTLALHPPREATSRAGKYPFTIVAVSVDDPSERATQLGTLEIGAFRAFEGELEPSICEVQKKANFQLTLHNRSNCGQDIRLTAQDEAAGCEFEFDKRKIRVEAGDTVVTRFKVKVKKRPKFDSPKRYMFTVIAEPDENADAAKKFPGQAVFKPIIPRWVLRGGVPISFLLFMLFWFFWPSEKPSIDQFEIEPSSITAGDSAMVTWEVQKASSVSIEPEPGNVGTSGSVFVSPAQTTEFTITAKTRRGAKKRAKAELTVEYPLPVIASFSSTPQIVKNPTAGVTLSWSVSDAEKIRIQPNIGTVDPVGSQTVYPERSTSYTLIATNRGGDVEKGLDVILETDRAGFDEETGKAEKQMTDFIETGKHLYTDKKLFDQAAGKFQRARKIYSDYEQKFGGNSKLAGLDGDARQWIDKIGFEGNKGAAKKAAKATMEEKMASAKVFYQMERFDEAKGDFQIVVAEYRGFAGKWGDDAELKEMSESAGNWISKMSNESSQGDAFKNTHVAMKEYVSLGKGFHDRGDYDQAVKEYQSCRRKYEEYKGAFGAHAELEELDKQAARGIERAELAKELEKR